MLELTTINTTELVNKKLGAQLNNIKKAVETGNNQQWKIADAIAKIVDDELFIDDFESEKNLASVLGMSRSNLNKMKNASHYHKEVSELNAFTLSKVMELLVIPKEDIVAFLDEYMVTASSTVREVRDAVSDWKDENVVAESKVSDADTDTDIDTDVDTNTDADTDTDIDTDVDTNTDAINEQDNCSTSNSTKNTLDNIYCLLNTMSESELIEVFNYIEKRLNHDN